MRNSVEKIYNDLFRRYPELSCVKEEIERVFEIIKETYINKGKLLVCGNGGSASDSTHIVGELMKGFMLKRELPECEKVKFNNKEIADGIQGAIPAISLVGDTALMTTLPIISPILECLPVVSKYKSLSGLATMIVWSVPLPVARPLE